jgi:hypothetical protein
MGLTLTKEHAAGFFIRMPLLVHPVINPTASDIKLAKDRQEKEFQMHVDSAPEWIKELFTAQEVEWKCGIKPRNPEDWKQPAKV